MTSTLRIVPHVVQSRPPSSAGFPALPASKRSLRLPCAPRRASSGGRPLGRAVGHAIERSSPFLSLIQAQASGWSIRWTSQLLWLARARFPRRATSGTSTVSARAGIAGRRGGRLHHNAAASDDHAAFGAVSYFWPDDDGEGPISLATEFLLEPLMVPVERLVDDPRTLGDAVSGCVGALQGSGRIATHGSDALVWFSARTLHRPPVADRSGWRFFLRVGLYREPYWQYADHRLCCHRLYDARTQQPLFRPVGTQETRRTWSGPLSQPIRPCG